mmetsp:Transcript_32414/g.81583  ORF Transcript_32414/g.81583 Transcript_32414/m.81583 type:complete len:300 (-) Transcript_32414:2552-3451(-)
MTSSSLPIPLMIGCVLMTWRLSSDGMLLRPLLLIIPPLSWPRTGTSLDGEAISLLECIPLPESSIALSEAQALPEPPTGSVKSDSRMLPAEGLPTFPVSRKPKRKNMRPTFRTDLLRPTRSCFMGCIGDEDGELVPARAATIARDVDVDTGGRRGGGGGKEEGRVEVEGTQGDGGWKEDDTIEGGGCASSGATRGDDGEGPTANVGRTSELHTISTASDGVCGGSGGVLPTPTPIGCVVLSWRPLADGSTSFPFPTPLRSAKGREMVLDATLVAAADWLPMHPSTVKWTTADDALLPLP